MSALKDPLQVRALISSEIKQGKPGRMWQVQAGCLTLSATAPDSASDHPGSALPPGPDECWRLPNCSPGTEDQNHKTEVCKNGSHNNLASSSSFFIRLTDYPFERQK
ncbi:hypothetical protein SprV_0501845100 [Sparganum proliferum]